MQDNNNDFNRKMEVLLLKMLLVHQVINHSTYKKVRGKGVELNWIIWHINSVQEQ